MYITKTIAGLPCIFIPLQEANAVTVEVMVKAGSVYESKEKNGMSHFLEHMFFKGGKIYKTPKDVAQAIESFGGHSNAYTGFENAGYYIKSAPSHVYKALDILSDMIVNPSFHEPEMEREKGVVIQEIAMYEDSPQELVMDKRRTWFFGENSYGREILGPAENVRSFTQADLFEHKKDLYTKDNMILVISGKITDQQDLEKHIAASFATLGDTKNYVKPMFEEYTPASAIGFYKKDISQNHLVISARGLAYPDDKKYAAKILSTILGGNMSSRLYQNVREKHGLCYYIGASHSSSPDYGTFYIRAGMDKDKFSFGVEKIFEEVAHLTTGGISDQEFDTAMGYTLGSLQMGIETTSSYASFYGNQFLMYNSIKEMKDLIERYKKITKKDVEDVLSYFAKENLFLYYVGNEEVL